MVGLGVGGTQGVERLTVGQRKQGGSPEDSLEDIAVVQVREVGMWTGKYRKRTGPDQ